MKDPLSPGLKARRKLTESTVSITNRLPDDVIRLAVNKGTSLMADLAEYISALTVYFRGANGELSESNIELVQGYLSSVASLQIKFPAQNHFEWAEERLRRAPLCLQLSIAHDKKNKDHLSSIIMWHLRHVIATIIDVDGQHSDSELREGRVILEILTSLLEKSGVAWSYDIFDAPTDVIEKLSGSGSQISAPENLEVCLRDLSNLVGLEAVKQEVATLINLVKVRQLRVARGLKMPDMSLHMVFTGNPGTGKTAVARLLGRIYKALGVLPEGHLIEVDRSGLVAGFIGQTAIKTMDILKKAHGGILFIDEAYSLVGKSESDFGAEAIDTILKYMEDSRDKLVVIAAGYPEEMQSFVNANPGLHSRFNKFVQFEDFSLDELYTVFLRLAESNGYQYDEKVAQCIYDALATLRNTGGNAFANARTIRNCFETIIQQQANRIGSKATAGEDDLSSLHEDDVTSAVSLISRRFGILP